MTGHFGGAAKASQAVPKPCSQQPIVDAFEFANCLGARMLHLNLLFRHILSVGHILIYDSLTRAHTYLHIGLCKSLCNCLLHAYELQSKRLFSCHTVLGTSQQLPYNLIVVVMHVAGSVRFGATHFIYIHAIYLNAFENPAEFCVAAANMPPSTPHLLLRVILFYRVFYVGRNYA